MAGGRGRGEGGCGPHNIEDEEEEGRSECVSVKVNNVMH